MTETFEKFAKDHGMDLAVIKTVEGPLYSDCNTDYAWLAWQASRQQALEESRVLCVWIADDWECAGMKDKASAANYLAESIRSLATRPTPTKGPTP